MKHLKIAFFIILVTLCNGPKINSQTCPECMCGVQPSGSGFDPSDTLIGGRNKPARSDIGGSGSEGFFPILVALVQFSDESGTNSSDPDAWNPLQPPNYINSIISPNRISGSNWWNTYNSFSLSDYWHEFSRGKLHITGQAVSITLPNTIQWYISNGGIGKVNKDIYDALIQSGGINWGFYDKWSIIRKGEFSWAPDGRLDMLYTVFRTRVYEFLPELGGTASLETCEGHTNFEYTVSSNPLVKIRGTAVNDSIGSGVRVNGFGSSAKSKQIFLNIAAHEHGHYLFGLNHKPYSKMSIGSAVEFSLSPWDVVKLGYIKQKLVHYLTSIYNLYDYSSRYGGAGDSGEVLQVPISSDGKEFLLLANRRRVSEWDRRMSGDTLADHPWASLKNINPNYGRGLYIYHVKNGYNFPESVPLNDLDMECADGLWNWEATGITRPTILKPDSLTPVIRRVYPSYNNDNPDPAITGYVSGRDEMSAGAPGPCEFSRGSKDLFDPLR